MPRIQYICSICRTPFGTEESAIECERSHIAPAEIIRTSFRHRHTDGPYPVNITVRMADGVEKTYKRA